MEQKSDLNILLDKFMSKYELEDISKSSIKYHFRNIYKNDYGNIFHALVQHKYDTKKVFKMLEILAEDKIVDINYTSQKTGYHFIQLALYGYTEDGEDFSYTTEFILELIRFAKKYNLNVNTIDKDGDSIIHTAIASEVYTGDVVPLIYELGPDFDIKCKDYYENDIYEALLKYKKEAKDGGEETKEWLKRLIKEEEEIKSLVSIGDITLDKIDDELGKIKKDLDTLLNNLDNNLFDNYEKIVEKIPLLNSYLEKRYLIDSAPTNYHNIETSINKKVVVSINKYLKSLTNSPEMKKIKELEKFLKNYSFNEELKLLKEAETKYLEYVDKLKTEINSCCCIADLIKKEEFIKELKDDELKQELLNLTCQRVNYYNDIIKKIKNIIVKNEFIDNWNTDTKIIAYEKQTTQMIDFSILNEKELLQYYQNELNKLEKYKAEILLKYGELVLTFISFEELTDNDILTSKEMEVVIKKFILEKNPKKRKNIIGDKK